ncbi:type VII secretion protein EccB [Actinomadura kijaniata]|uniref:type VII secretion protein EccB n=1 Tax=Actinomadura kijaniata TaxID=46161 RepID=UPI003F1D65BC
MQTRKDLLQAHRLMTQRASLALISGEPDHPELPLRRMNIAGFSGVMIAILVCAACGIFGIIRPGGARGLEKAGMLIVEKETGARYVWCQDGRLCPVTNYVSARLVAGADAKSRRTVSANSLSKYERGPMIGIPGAPNTLPDRKKLTRGPWSVCVRAVDGTSTGRQSLVTLMAGRGVGGTRMRDDQAVVVQADGQNWLIWRNQRMLMSQSALITLGATPVPISGKWLDSVTQGPNFAPPQIPDLGQPATGPNGKAQVGRVFEVRTSSGGQTAYVLRKDGLAPLTPIQRDLMLADRGTWKAYGNKRPVPVQIDASQVGQMGQSTQQVRDPRLDGRAPSLAAYKENSPLCAVYDDPTGNSDAKLTIGGTLPTPPPGPQPTGADQLVFPPGSASVAGRVPSPGKADKVDTYYLVAEGKRFPIKNPETAEKLGYTLPGDAAKVPAGVLDLIAQGQPLDPDKVSINLPLTTQAGS